MVEKTTGLRPLDFSILRAGQVLEYLGRYSHRVAISNRRLLSMDETSVTFQWKDYREPGRSKRMQLTGVEFIRRFLLHSLPLRVQRIRHYGLLSNRRRKGALAECRRQLGAGATDLLPSLEECQAVVERVRTESLNRCPACRTGLRLVVEMIGPRRNGERVMGVNSS
jgi:Putative transposase